MPLGDIPVTVVIPVRNEEQNLPRCLGALAGFTEIVVVDSGSTDRTPEIARRLGAEYLKFSWNGRYPKKRNWALLTHTFRNDWILFLDADEIVDLRFCDELRSKINTESYSAYWLNYSNYFRGERLRHGVAQRKLALIRKGAGLYEKVDEQGWSGLDMEVHEHPIVEGPVGEIRAPIEHRDFRGVQRFLQRHLEYAVWESRRYLALRNAAPGSSAKLTSRQRFKYKNIARWWYAPVYFIFAYFCKFGLLDGSAGFSYALYKAWYFYTIRVLIGEHAAELLQPDSDHAAYQGPPQRK